MKHCRAYHVASVQDIHLFKKGSCQLLAKVCARSTVNRLGGLSLPRKSVVRLTDRPDMTLNVYRGRKTTMQQQMQQDIHHLSCTCTCFNPIAFRTAKTLWSFGRFECNRVKVS